MMNETSLPRNRPYNRSQSLVRAISLACLAPFISTGAGLRFEGSELRLGENGPSIAFHGFLSQGFLYSTEFNYLAPDSTDGSFEFNELGVNASLSPFKRTRISAQIFSFDVGKVGNHPLMLDSGMIDYRATDWLGLRVGRIKRPRGSYNHIQDVDVGRTWVLLPQGLYDARFRDFTAAVDGASVYGEVALGQMGSLSYELYWGTYSLSDEGGLARLVENSLPPPPIASLQSVFGGESRGAQLWWNTPLSGLRFGSYLGYETGVGADVLFASPMGAAVIRQELSIPIQHYSAEWFTGSWTFQFEYRTMNRTTDRRNGPVLLESARSRNESWYLAAAYRLNSWFEVGSYYTEYYEDASNRNGSDLPVPSDGFQKDLALTLRFDPKPWCLLKLEAHYIEGTALLHNPGSNPIRDDRGWWLLTAKTTFNF